MTDEGFGIRVIEALQKRYSFPANVSVVDGGVLGLNLLGVISAADYLVVIDAIRNGGTPGDIFRLTGQDVPDRIRAKNSLHQVDFLEALTLCQLLEKVPETVILGVEPADIDTLSLELTDQVRRQIDPVIGMMLGELDRLNIPYHSKETAENG